jgi:hypothetical protein
VQYRALQAALPSQAMNEARSRVPKLLAQLLSIKKTSSRKGEMKFFLKASAGFTGARWLQ